MKNARAMKVTTVRFSEDLWATIQAEAEIAGVSASQFIREAALARASAASAARGELPFDRGSLRELGPAAPDESQSELQAALSILARAASGSLRSESEALRAESRQVRRAAAARRARRAEDGAKPPA
jgi:Mobilization protein NikA